MSRTVPARFGRLLRDVGGPFLWLFALIGAGLIVWPPEGERTDDGGTVRPAVGLKVAAGDGEMSLDGGPFGPSSHRPLTAWNPRVLTVEWLTQPVLEEYVAASRAGVPDAILESRVERDEEATQLMGAYKFGALWHGSWLPETYRIYPRLGFFTGETVIGRGEFAGTRYSHWAVEPDEGASDLWNDWFKASGPPHRLRGVGLSLWPPLVLAALAGGVRRWRAVRRRAERDGAGERPGVARRLLRPWLLSAAAVGLLLVAVCWVEVGGSWTRAEVLRGPADGPHPPDPLMEGINCPGEARDRDRRRLGGRTARSVGNAVAERRSVWGVRDRQPRVARRVRPRGECRDPLSGMAPPWRGSCSKSAGAAFAPPGRGGVTRPPLPPVLPAMPDDTPADPPAAAADRRPVTPWARTVRRALPLADGAAAVLAVIAGLLVFSGPRSETVVRVESGAWRAHLLPQPRELTVEARWDTPVSSKRWASWSWQNRWFGVRAMCRRTSLGPDWAMIGVPVWMLVGTGLLAGAGRAWWEASRDRGVPTPGRRLAGDVLRASIWSAALLGAALVLAPRPHLSGWSFGLWVGEGPDVLFHADRGPKLLAGRDAIGQDRVIPWRWLFVLPAAGTAVAVARFVGSKSAGAGEESDPATDPAG